MTSANAPSDRAAPPGDPEANWTLRSLIARHKRASIGVLAIIVVMLAVFVATVVGPGAGAVSDLTSCSGWGSADQTQQHAYALLYLKEHGPLPNRAADAASVEASVNKGCGQAFDNDVADSINVYQAINNQY